MQAEEIYLARQPIVDAQKNLIGFELLFRSPKAVFAEVNNDIAATTTVITNAFTEMGIDQVLGPYKGFINVSGKFLFSDMIEALPKERVVLELLENTVIDQSIIDRCRELRKQGYQIALDDFIDNEARFDDLIQTIDFLKVDLVLLEQKAITALMQKVQRYPVQMLAEKVETQQQYEWARKIGFNLYQGYHFARPQLLVGKRASPAKVALLRLLAMVLSDADTHKIEEEFKKYPQLGVNLLRLSNSAVFGLSQKVSSLRHALALLGRRQLQVWLQLLLYTADSSNKSLASPLLQLAAERGRLMELIMTRRYGEKSEPADQAFMTGILSLMDVLLEMPLEDVLSQLSLPGAVNQALLKRQGEIGRLFMGIEKLERQDDTALEDLHAVLPDLQGNEFAQMQLMALQWASAITSETK